MLTPLVLFPRLYSTAHQRARRLSLGTPYVDTGQHPHDYPIQRTQTIEFAPYPQPRHRASRDKSRLRNSTSEMAPRPLPPEVFATDYGDRAFSYHRNTLAC